ncbi:MAG TPA: hypothetical protein VF137_00700 [Candidatus Dormibacteraeota bacterium]
MRLAAAGMDGPEVDAVLARLERDDVVGQLRSGTGRAAELACDDGRVMLDWVDAIPRLLDRPGAVDSVRQAAAELLGSADQVAWAGMGGSVQAVRCLAALHPQLPIRPLDSTDPAALLDLWHATDGLSSSAAIGVAMGMTSEEPLTHLRWFGAAAPGRPRLAMAIPGSVLEEYARSDGLAQLPVQPDRGAGTPGRMSAPGTHVFLLPAAMALGDGLEGALAEIAAADLSPYLRLAAWLHVQIAAGADKVLLDSDDRLLALEPWIEQVVEESLGKGGRGLLIFPGQERGLLEAPPDDCRVLRLEIDGDVDVATIGAAMAGWCWAVAVLGCLEGITFAGQPAVEAYKRYARDLRDAPGELPLPARAQALELEELAAGVSPHGYLDLTLNAAESTPGWPELAARFRRHANESLRRPAKLRIAPAHYHSTEQAQVDGPPGVHSIRLVLLDRPVAPGAPYPPRFLHAQALGTARAMADAGRPVSLVVLEGLM